MKNFWIIAGEASGDMYGAELAGELRKLAAENGEEVNITGMGGPKMMAAKVPVKVDSTELGVMGIFEISKILFTFIKIYFQLVKAAKSERPDAVILIDYPGFNLLFALAIAIVFRGIPYWIGLLVIPTTLLFIDRKALKMVDYPLLFTFVFFFIFSGNMARIEVVRDLFSMLLDKSTLLFSVVSCQFISNVPSAILLSQFTGNYSDLLVVKIKQI